MRFEGNSSFYNLCAPDAHLCWFARTTVTKCHELGILNSRNLLPHFWKPQIEDQSQIEQELVPRGGWKAQAYPLFLVLTGSCWCLLAYGSYCPTLLSFCLSSVYEFPHLIWFQSSWMRAPPNSRITGSLTASVVTLFPNRAWFFSIHPRAKLFTKIFQTMRPLFSYLWKFAQSCLLASKHVVNMFGHWRQYDTRVKWGEAHGSLFKN